MVKHVFLRHMSQRAAMVPYFLPAFLPWMQAPKYSINHNQNRVIQGVQVTILGPRSKRDQNPKEKDAQR